MVDNGQRTLSEITKETLRSAWRKTQANQLRYPCTLFYQEPDFPRIPPVEGHPTRTINHAWYNREPASHWPFPCRGLDVVTHRVTQGLGHFSHRRAQPRHLFPLGHFSLGRALPRHFCPLLLCTTVSSQTGWSTSKHLSVRLLKPTRERATTYSTYISVISVQAAAHTINNNAPNAQAH